MSRYSDTSDTIKKTTGLLIDRCDNPKKISTEEMLSGIFNILVEIALSLAMIADKEAENDDLISRSALKRELGYTDEWYDRRTIRELIDNAPPVPTYTFKEVDEIRQATIEQTRISCKYENSKREWIPVSERLPNDLEPVNITWINHDPEPYYKEIKDKPFTATGVLFNGQWYWWSTLCTDILAVYQHNHDDIIDEAIEIIAWMPLPEAYKEEAENE